MNNLSATMLKNHEDVKGRETNSGDREEVHGPRYIQMIPKERQPSDGLLVGPVGLNHVLPDGVLAGRIVEQIQQREANHLCAPKWILSAELSDQVTHLLGDRRAPRSASGLPGLVHFEGAGVPLLDGGRLHQLCSGLPWSPQLRQDDPQKPKARGEPGPGMLLLLNPPLTHGQLTLGSYQPGSERRPGLQEHAGEAQEVTNQLTDASEAIPKVSEQVDDGIHASGIARIAADDNLS